MSLLADPATYGCSIIVASFAFFLFLAKALYARDGAFTVAATGWCSSLACVLASIGMGNIAYGSWDAPEPVAVGVFAAWEASVIVTIGLLIASFAASVVRVLVDVPGAAEDQTCPVRGDDAERATERVPPAGPLLLVGHAATLATFYAEMPRGSRASLARRILAEEDAKLRAADDTQDDVRRGG